MTATAEKLPREDIVDHLGPVLETMLEDSSGERFAVALKFYVRVFGVTEVAIVSLDRLLHSEHKEEIVAGLDLTLGSKLPAEWVRSRLENCGAKLMSGIWAVGWYPCRE